MGIDAAFYRAHRHDALVAQRGYCRYCFQALTRATATADHRVPRSKGGPNHPDNIVAACANCNVVKAAMSELAFIKAISDPKPHHSIKLWMIWSRRTINVAVHHAEKRIFIAVGLHHRAAAKPIPTRKRAA